MAYKYPWVWEWWDEDEHRWQEFPPHVQEALNSAVKGERELKNIDFEMMIQKNPATGAARQLRAYDQNYSWFDHTKNFPAAT